jgi:hypothetical protein
MARTQIPTTTVIRAGVTQPLVTYADITNNHQIKDNNGRVWVEMANVSNAGSVNITFDVVPTYDNDLTIYDLIVALAPGGTKLAGPFKTGVFNQPTESAIYFDVSSTGVSFRSYKLSS